MTHEPGAQIIDAGAVTVWIASFAQILPSIAALLSIIWFAIRIIESDTVQGLLGDWGWIKKENKNGVAKDQD